MQKETESVTHTLEKKSTEGVSEGARMLAQ